MDYSKTVCLPQTNFPMKANLPQREPAWLAAWEAGGLYQKALAQRQSQQAKKTFVLHDGPPYANGHLHLGHALNKILKDLIVRTKTMAGFYAPYVPGWDCHGLPIELQLMKELKIADKHAVDRETFRAQAKVFAEKFVAIQRDEFKRMGILGDWEHPYLTLDESYKKIIVQTFEELQKKGYVYRGKKPVYWCMTDETALAEAEVEYENDPGPSIYVAFPSTEENISYVVWTTTPWTLPANVAIARHPRESYVRFEVIGTGKKYIVAAKRLSEFQKITGLAVSEPTPVEYFPEPRHPWIVDRKIQLVEAEFVAMDTGTGLVHIAPGHGAEDFQVGAKYSLPVLSPVDERGCFTDEVPEWKGQHVFKANPRIVEWLKQKGALLHAEEIVHSYPHCWRCHRPVIFRATEQWFLSIDHQGLRKRLLETMEGVKWIPAYGKNRMTGMVEARPDWCLSRQRLWGTEIPSEAPGSKPPAPGASSFEPRANEPDIFDVWFESGVSWAAVLKERPELRYPADMYLEGSDQHRGWFQTSLIPSVALENQAPYKAVLTHGFVMDGEGRPMSKSLGNVIAPDEVIQQYGADVLRLWVASSDYAGDVRLSPEILKGLTDNYRKVRNTFRYLLGTVSGFDAAKDAVDFSELSALDRWALAQLRLVTEGVLAAYEAYEFHRGTAALVDFCNSTLSGFYLDVLKDRLYCDPASSGSGRGARTVVWQLADVLCRLWAPLLPFTADEAWHDLGHAESVALADFPAPNPEWQDPGLAAIFPIRQTVLGALEKARQDGRIKSGLGAKISLHAEASATREILKRYGADWAAFCIVSTADVLTAARMDRADASAEGVQVWVEPAPGQKCGRCWIYKVDVGADPHWPDVCARCAAAVDEWQRTHPETGS